ncbi:MAG TPA: RhuM family protein [Steroidobacteraceae bacterium]|nr:RhuM family protein [Steroidobacteraceae bacterium]
MSQLFGRERSVITKHLRNVFQEGELREEGIVQNLHIAGSDKPVRFYSPDVIISVGYRVKSAQGTRFRQWATATLREHLVRRYTLDRQRLEHAVLLKVLSKRWTEREAELSTENCA